MLMLLTTAVLGQSSTIPTQEKQRSAAVSPAPENLRNDAKVLGYNSDGELITIREGSNQLVCVADNPEQDNFHVACYHSDLAAFMERGRTLRAEGMSREEVDSLRREEIESGKIPMPRKPMALYSLTGSADAYNYETEQVVNASPMYVIYVPYETQQSTGLPAKPSSKGAPWLMEPGTPWAHIMIMTGRDIGK